MRLHKALIFWMFGYYPFQPYKGYSFIIIGILRYIGEQQPGNSYGIRSLGSSGYRPG